MEGEPREEGGFPPRSILPIAIPAVNILCERRVLNASSERVSRVGSKLSVLCRMDLEHLLPLPYLGVTGMRGEGARGRTRTCMDS